MIQKRTHVKLSEISVSFENINGVTDVSDMFMTPPLRVMRPFFEDDFTEIMVMSSSPGLLEGDRQLYSFHAGQGTKARVLSQSYEKIHPMNSGTGAKRKTLLNVEREATLVCKFLPAILFRDSSYENEIEVSLVDETSKLILTESFAAGRIGRGESYKFRDFRNSISVKMGDELIYFENNYVNPSKIPYDQIGYFEGYDHFSSLSIFNFGNTSELNMKIQKILEEMEASRNIHAGVSTTYRGDIQIRILSNMGQDLIETIEPIIKCAEEYII